MANRFKGLDLTDRVPEDLWMEACNIVQGFPGGQMVKHLPTMQETQVQSLGWEDLLEKGMATHSSILAWKIRWMEEPVG